LRGETTNKRLGAEGGKSCPKKYKTIIFKHLTADDDQRLNNKTKTKFK